MSTFSVDHVDSNGNHAVPYLAICALKASHATQSKTAALCLSTHM